MSQAVGANNQSLASEINQQHGKAKAQLTKQFNEQQVLLRELAETKHAQQMAGHHRIQQLRDIEYQRNLRTIHERAEADLQNYLQKEASVERRVQELQSELKQAQALGTPTKSSEKKSSSMPSPVPYVQDDTRDSAPPWPFVQYPPSVGVTSGSSVLLQ